MPQGIVAQAARPRGAHGTDYLWLHAEGARADDRIVRIGIDVQHRGEVQIDADDSELGRGCPAGSIGEIAVVARADPGRGGKVGERPGQAMDISALLVDGDKRRLTRCAVPKIAAQRQDLPRLAAISTEKNKAAKIVFGKNQSLVPAEALAPAADHDHLADFFPEQFHAGQL